jgi:hypothetical protein
MQLKSNDGNDFIQCNTAERIYAATVFLDTQCYNFTLPGITLRLQTIASCMLQTTAQSLLLEGKAWQRVALG